MKIEINIRKEHLILLMAIIILTPVFAAIVSHDASQIQSGILGLIYDGNWSFMNGSIGINITTPTKLLEVKGDTNITGDLYVKGTITANSFGKSACYWTGYSEINEIIECTTGYYVVAAQCGTTGADGTCDEIRIRCCRPGT